MKPFETKREEMLYYMVEFFNEVLSSDSDELMNLAEVYATSKMLEA